ncbi:MAG: HD domain-containing protein [Lachnospiraceae bacterium]|nr:HD domain-containing protein [Lachnospiraceae bacterium]
MLFKKSDDLKVGMRLARPIYNKSGVLLYERNSLLSPQGIESIKKFGLIGIYILEPAEPVPPMTQADLEFERFQSMCVFAIADEMQRIQTMKKQERMHIIVADIQKNYGHLNSKVNFIQNLRSNEDYIFKHSMNVAILTAMLGNRLRLTRSDRNDTLIAALIHDLGKLSLPMDLVLRESLDTADKQAIKNAMVVAFSLIDEVMPANPAVKRMCIQYMKLKDAADKGNVYRAEDKIMIGAQVLLLADTFDSMTAMRYGEPPASEVAAIKYIIKNEDIYNRTVINALTESINIFNAGVSVELNNGDKALVIAENHQDILRPMVLTFRDNSIIDLSNRASANIEIKDIMKTMDNRHVMDIATLKNQGFTVEAPEFVEPRS